VIIRFDQSLLSRIQQHGEKAYPEEGAGLLLGVSDEKERQVVDILALENSREGPARHNRYLISPQDIYQAELTAEALGLDVIGVFHSHPDHPAVPSEFDREWAMPWFSYIITSIGKGSASQSRSWRLTDDRERFEEEQIQVALDLPRAPAAQESISQQEEGI
jgi:proteasome lid subunit RPN8/RPN11